ncbi:hypothetical protein [Nocardia asiatica]|uniref:hypothetical protein n=1 Tax=Nocardia asiatica TaxID=209252 RepID=UPI002455342D|nr:hypothetical protein [Nocardia asiatica]
MRVIVRVLREDQPFGEGDRTPSPGIADLDRLAEHTGAGPPVDVEISGDVTDLPATLGTAIYRLAQESVTNAVRHARHATRIEARVTADDTAVPAGRARRRHTHALDGISGIRAGGAAMLTQAVHAAARGDALIAPSVTARLLAAFAAGGPVVSQVQPARRLPAVR